jgi:hypothetical protein
MIARPTFLLIVILLTGCQTENVDRHMLDSVESVYQLIISDLAQKAPPDARFVGTKVWVAPEFNKGDSLFYSWGDDIDVDNDLIEALKQASRETSEFPATEQFGADGHITEIESFHDLDYYGEGSKPIDAKCLVQFWRPGYTDNGKRAVVRFYYGPSPHGAAGTYVLQYTDGGWQIVASTISYYV